MSTQPIRNEPHTAASLSRLIACFQCSHQNQPGSKFCSACGRSFERRTANTRPAFTGAGWAAYQEMFARKWNVYRLVRRALCLGSVGLILIWFGVQVITHSASRDELLGVPIGIIFFAFLLGLALRPRWLSKREYYALPESQGPHGEHRCVKCNHRGIYRSGQYKTNNHYAQCSKCELNLFKE